MVDFHGQRNGDSVSGRSCVAPGSLARRIQAKITSVSQKIYSFLRLLQQWNTVKMDWNSVLRSGEKRKSKNRWKEGNSWEVPVAFMTCFAVCTMQSEKFKTATVCWKYSMSNKGTFACMPDSLLLLSCYDWLKRPRRARLLLRPYEVPGFACLPLFCEVTPDENNSFLSKLGTNLFSRFTSFYFWKFPKIS